MPETATAEPTMRDHFQAAVEEHSKEQAPAAESKVATVPGETETTATPTTEPSDKAAEPVADTADQLLTQEDLAKLSPEQQATYKRMQGSYTQKTQKLAEDRKQVEALNGFVAAMEADPAGTIRKLAEANGLAIADTPKSDKQVEAAAEDTLAAIQSAVDEGGLIDIGKLAQAIDGVVQKGIAKLRDSEVTPLKQHQEQILADTAAKQSEAVIQAFSTKHPDWNKHEPKMLEIGRKLQPSTKMDEGEYMEMLYHLATRDIQSAEQTRDVIVRLNKAAATAEPQVSGVQPNRVSQKAPLGDVPFSQIWEDAKKGIRYED